MYNWSVDTRRLKKSPEKWEQFKLEQMINFGLNGKKLSSTSLKKHWQNLTLDPHKKAYLASVLWPDKS